jgi:hypothetical protein
MMPESVSEMLRKRQMQKMGRGNNEISNSGAFSQNKRY